MNNTNKTKRTSLSEVTKAIEVMIQISEKKKEIRKELSHIKKPYSLQEILDQYSEGHYNAELLLQHALLLLTKSRL